MKHPHVAIVERFFSCFASDDHEGIRSVLADDVRWIIPGRHAHAGTKRGVQEVLGYFEVLQRTGLRAEPLFLEANETCVVDLHRVYSTRGPVKLDGLSVLMWRVEGGRVVEVRNFPGDQYQWDEFFGAIDLD